MLKTRQIPGTDLNVSQIALGSADWPKVSPDDLDRLYETYRAAGGNCLDTAHCYSFWVDAEGKPEMELGRLVRKYNDRANVIIATKGCHLDGGAKYPRPARYMTPETLASDINDSLERLRMEVIDLYYLHRDDPAVPVDEILDALHQHQLAGRIRYYAASNWQPARLEQAAEYCRRKGIPPFVASQVQFNLAHLARPLSPDLAAINDQQEDWYERSQIPVFAYAATANGYFAVGKSTYASYDDDISARRREHAIEVGRQVGAGPGEVALAYLMTLPFLVIPITGTTKVDHLKSNLSAAGIQLTRDQLRYLKE